MKDLKYPGKSLPYVMTPGPMTILMRRNKKRIITKKASTGILKVMVKPKKWA